MRKHHSPAFKAQVVRELLKEVKSVSQLAAQYDVHPNQLYRWREVAPVASGRAFARLISTADGIYQVSGVALGEQAQARVERFVWH